MASGHVNRTNRPNTWLHRPSLRREDSPCQPGAVHTWPEAAENDVHSDVGYWGVKRTRYAHCEFWRSWVLTRMYGPGRASQEVFVDLSDVGLASMYPASHWSVS